MVDVSDDDTHDYANYLEMAANRGHLIRSNPQPPSIPGTSSAAGGTHQGHIEPWLVEAWLVGWETAAQYGHDQPTNLKALRDEELAAWLKDRAALASLEEKP